MPASGSQLSAAKRPKWPHVSMGIALIVVAVALTVGWQILGASDGPARRARRAPCAGSSTSSAACSSCC